MLITRLAALGGSLIPLGFEALHLFFAEAGFFLAFKLDPGLFVGQGLGLLLVFQQIRLAALGGILEIAGFTLLTQLFVVGDLGGLGQALLLQVSFALGFEFGLALFLQSFGFKTGSAFGRGLDMAAVMAVVPVISVLVVAAGMAGVTAVVVVATAAMAVFFDVIKTQVPGFAAAAVQ